MVYVPEKLAVECPECGYRGRRKHDQDPPSCSKCGHFPLHIGWPSQPVFQTKSGHLGGRRVLTWTEWR